MTDNESSSVTLNKLAMNVRSLYCNFMKLTQDSLLQDYSILKLGQKSQYCLEYDDSIVYCMSNKSGLRTRFLGFKT